MQYILVRAVSVGMISVEGVILLIIHEDDSQDSRQEDNFFNKTKPYGSR